MNDETEEIEEEVGKQTLWYVRRKGKPQGPFPSGTVRRFVSLGRILLTDEVSMDKEQWQKVSEVPEVVSPEIRKAAAEGRLDELLPTKLREDERTGNERRSPNAPPKVVSRRQGERREDEPEIAQRHRKAKTTLKAEVEKEKSAFPLIGAAVIAVLVAVVLGYGFLVDGPEKEPDPDCTAAAAPGVNWRNCRLDGLEAEGKDMQGALLNNAVLRGGKLSGSLLNGADLQYVDFSGSDLSYSEMQGALLKGAGLRKADLSYADLTNADLSFSDLSGANLGGSVMSGARFDNAIWIDGKTCEAGSVGRCITR
ncbi:MAG: pentapeptide repeat-containing protein [Sedimenticola sp.]